MQERFEGRSERNDLGDITVVAERMMKPTTASVIPYAPYRRR